ncbi:fluoride efflux transporter FluC [Poriferisphaera sp. WC338]|uniref:fluoride efflux transporter FluC n=1 Tax=Poriferisphaera sp. WC338 TaxID=3425129 RepID=UPI003D818A0D
MAEQFIQAGVGVNVLLVGVGGMLGSLSRYGVGKFVHWAHPMEMNEWPLYVSASGTIMVNALGCFFFGLIWGALHEWKASLSPMLMLALLTGFMGAFTTFSTFAFEGYQLYVRHGIWSAAGYWFIQNVAGFVLVVIGVGVGKLMYTTWLVGESVG